MLICYCKRIPDGLQGHLNTTQILKDANLSNLVQFYDEEIKKNDMLWLG